MFCRNNDRKQGGLQITHFWSVLTAGGHCTICIIQLVIKAVVCSPAKHIAEKQLERGIGHYLSN